MDKNKLKPLNILLADDDEDDCMFFKRALDEMDLSTQFFAVHDGEQLIKHLSQNLTHLPHIIFLDYNMPRKNGLECLHEIKNNNDLKHIPVVMFSTSNNWDTINSLFKSGAHVYIRKPSDFGQLKQVIFNAIPLAAEKIFSNSPVKYTLNVTPNPDR